MSPFTTKELFINIDTFGEDGSLLGFMWIFLFVCDKVLLYSPHLLDSLQIAVALDSL